MREGLMASSGQLVSLRSGISVRKNIYDGLTHRLSLGDKWQIVNGQLFILFGATCPAHSMESWLTDDAGPEVAAILDDLESCEPVT